jgi:hypothetical protein
MTDIAILPQKMIFFPAYVACFVTTNKRPRSWVRMEASLVPRVLLSIKAPDNTFQASRIHPVVACSSNLDDTKTSVVNRQPRT